MSVRSIGRALDSYPNTWNSIIGRKFNFQSPISVSSLGMHIRPLLQGFRLISYDPESYTHTILWWIINIKVLVLVYLYRSQDGTLAKLFSSTSNQAFLVSIMKKMLNWHQRPLTARQFKDSLNKIWKTFNKQCIKSPT